ncbi:hypothetical protein AGMMS50222_10890 [Endomicrobiia bacterium]|nr:hypothetical protein AGMMS49531_01320 [Endomicrobiia bacterium]GHT72939.1 hypothetical protein AGMMS49950_11440 [Endomicrobiia bacterium]GHT77406.1 hypothetical protein AGMMS50222_10890 [Endomicrobiia bacterium]
MTGRFVSDLELLELEDELELELLDFDGFESEATTHTSGP